VTCCSPRRRRPVPDRVRRDLIDRDYEIIRPDCRPARPHRHAAQAAAPEASPGEPRQVQPIRYRKMSTPCGAVGAAVATHGPARVLNDVGQDAWHSTVRLVYGVCMVSSFRFGGGMGSRPRRAHSRLGGAAVVTDSGEVARTVRTAADHAALNGQKRCPRPAPEPAARTGQHGRTSGLRLRIGRLYTVSPADSKVL
jgi:hypothetical protein